VITRTLCDWLTVQDMNKMMMHYTWPVRNVRNKSGKQCQREWNMKENTLQAERYKGIKYESIIKIKRGFKYLNALHFSNFVHYSWKTTPRISPCASVNASYMKDMHMVSTLSCNRRSENCHLFQPTILQAPHTGTCR
jgi:hypothetical protein